MRKVHDVLSSALTSAQADGLIDSNPAKQPGAKPPTGAEVKAKPEMVIWTPAQLDRFLEWAYEATPDLYVCWLLIGSTGLRRGKPSVRAGRMCPSRLVGFMYVGRLSLESETTKRSASRRS